MSGWTEWWVDHLGVLLAGASAILILGTLLCLRSKAPIHRQRTAQWTVLTCLAWLAVTVAPFDRFEWPERETVASTELARPFAPVNGPVSFDASRPPRSPVRSVRVEPPAATVATPRPNEPAEPVGSADQRRWAWLALALLAGGSGIALLYLAAGVVALRRVVRRAENAAPWVYALTEPASRSRRVRIVVSQRAERPFCCGLLRPAIVLPARLCDRGQAPRLRQVLFHELAHIDQRDLWGQALFALALPVLFWNPLLFWLRAQARLAAELIADDVAAGRTDATSYARELIDLAGQPLRRPAVGLAALSVIGAESEFYRRMKMLLNRESRLATRCPGLQRMARGTVAVVIVGVSAVVFGAPSLVAQDASSRSAERQLRALKRERDALESEIAELRRAIGLASSDRGTTDAISRVIAILGELGTRDRERALRQLMKVQPRLELAEPAPAAVAPPVPLVASQPAPVAVNAPGRVVVAVPDPVAAPLVARTPVAEPARPDAPEPAADPTALTNPLVANDPVAIPMAPPPVPASGDFGFTAGDPGAAPAPRGSYVLDLVNRSIDFRSDIHAVETQLAQTERLFEKGYVTAAEREGSKAALEALVEKQEAVRALIRAELEAAEIGIDAWRARLARTKKGEPEYFDARLELKRLEARIQLLRRHR